MAKTYREDPDRDLFCVDWEELGEQLAIWGVEDDTDSY